MTRRSWILNDLSRPGRSLEQQGVKARKTRPSGSESSSDSEMEMQAARRRQKEMNSSRWAIDSDSDSSEDDRRVVRGAKEKFHDELRMIIRRVNNHVKVLDFGSLSDEYDRLLKCMQKSQSVVKDYGVPKFFVSVLVELETFLDEKFRDKDAIKKLSKAKATSFNTLRAKFRKSVEEYRQQMEDCKSNPQAYQDADASDDESGSSYSSSSYSGSSSGSSSSSSSDSDDSDSRDGESSDSSESDSSSSSSDWSSYEDEYEDRHASALAKWGTRTKSTKKKEKEGGKKAHRQKHVKKELQEVAPGSGTAAPSGDLLSFEGEVTVEMIVEKVGEIVAARGKKGTDRQEQIRLLKKAAEISRPLSLQAYADVLTHLISAQFDTITGAFHCITSGIWLEICDNINILLDLVLLNNKEKRVFISGFQSFISSKDRRRKVSGEASAPVTGAEGQTFDSEGLATLDDGSSTGDVADLKEQDKSTVTFLVSFIERLDGESLKALQLTDVHSSEYKDRLVQSLHLLALLWRCYKICEEREYFDLVSSLSVHLINQLHFKSDSLAVKTLQAQRADNGAGGECVQVRRLQGQTEGFDPARLQHGSTRQLQRGGEPVPVHRGLRDGVGVRREHPDPVQPLAGAAGAVRLQARADLGGAAAAERDLHAEPEQGAAGAGDEQHEVSGKDSRAGAGGEAETAALPHAPLSGGD
ncbi:putative eukaryotic initiation factor-3, subunit 8 [Cryptosporidium felis]|nr:putative eukaryotic initiation factor-3, subunit 8 [Cryptosporidium felis]